MIAGIVIGVVVFAVIVGIIIYKYKKSKELINTVPESTNEMINIQNNHGSSNVVYGQPQYNNGSTNVMYGQPQYTNQAGYYPQQQPHVTEIHIGSHDKVMFA